ncbi:MAG: hypothetical protein J4G05_07180 [Chlorobi bacterium]|nr:hypothetical protein [Chlorobiota bacterium]
MNIYRIVLLFILIVASCNLAFAQPFQETPLPATGPPGIPVPLPAGIVAPINTFGPPLPSIWIWGNGSATPQPSIPPPSIGLEFRDNSPGMNLLSRSQWGIASVKGELSTVATPKDAILVADEGEDLILSVRHTGSNDVAQGAIRFSTLHHIDPNHWAFPNDLERMTVASNGMVGVQHPEPQRTLHVGDRWGHPAVIRISRDQYSNVYDPHNNYIKPLAIAELVVEPGNIGFSSLANPNDFVIRTSGGDGNPASDIILTTQNPGAALRIATSEVFQQEIERLTVQDGGDVTIGGSVGIGFQPDQSLWNYPRWQQQRKLDIRGGQVGITPKGGEPGILSIMPSGNGSWWNMGNISDGGMLAFMPGDLLTNVPSDANVAAAEAAWADAVMVLSANHVVGLGTVTPDWAAGLHLHEKPFLQTKNGINNRLQTAIVPLDGAFSSSSTTGDIVIRTMEGSSTEDLILASSSQGAALKFATRRAGDGGSDPGEGDNSVKMTIFDNGNVGIGVDRVPFAKLAVNGTICAEEIKVLLRSTSDAACWPDYVFEEGYNLMPLTELEQWVTTHRHLPNIPSRVDVEKNGVEIGEFQAQLLRKIEEMTLYIIALEKRIKTLENEKEQKE